MGLSRPALAWGHDPDQVREASVAGSPGCHRYDPRLEPASRARDTAWAARQGRADTSDPGGLEGNYATNFCAAMCCRRNVDRWRCHGCSRRSERTRCAVDCVHSGVAGLRDAQRRSDRVQTFVLKNSGGSATVALTVSLSGSVAFTKRADSCTATSLGPNKMCSVTVTYAPTTTGTSDSATLTGPVKKRARLQPRPSPARPKPHLKSCANRTEARSLSPPCPTTCGPVLGGATRPPTISEPRRTRLQVLASQTAETAPVPAGPKEWPTSSVSVTHALCLPNDGACRFRGRGRPG